MASNTVFRINNGAILVASDLCTGTAVCLGKTHCWTNNWREAWIIRNDAEASSAMEHAAKAVANNEVIDAYLVDTNADGEPTHTRERLRINGPSVDYLSVSIRDSEASEDVSIR